MRKLIGGTLLLLMAYMAYPYFALWRLGQALNEGDVISLETLVDWPRVREGIKAQVKSQMLDKMMADKSPSGGLGSLLGLAMAPAMVDTLIDGYVSAQGLANAFAERRHELAGRPLTSLVGYAFFVAPSEFRVDLNPGLVTPSSKPSVLFMSFAGLGWKITGVSVPFDQTLMDAKNRPPQ